MRATSDVNIRPDFDQEIKDIAEYVTNKAIASEEAYHTARLCLLDTLGCVLLGLNYPDAPIARPHRARRHLNQWRTGAGNSFH